MRIRKRNRILKRIVLGFALVALIVPSAVSAYPDAGRSYEPSKSEAGFVPFVTDSPHYLQTVNAGAGTPVGMPHAGLNDYLRSRDGVELVRLEPRSTLRNSDLIEQVRVSPREVSAPQAVASPGFNWGDAGIGAGVLAGIALLGAAALIATRHLGRAQTA